MGTEDDDPVEQEAAVPCEGLRALGATKELLSIPNGIEVTATIKSETAALSTVNQKENDIKGYDKEDNKILHFLKPHSHSDKNIDLLSFKDNNLTSIQFVKRAREGDKDNELEERQPKKQLLVDEILEIPKLACTVAIIPEINEDNNMPQLDSFWKTTLCSYFRRSTGSSCNHGDACRYAHGEHELRLRPDNTWDPTSQKAKKMLNDPEVDVHHRSAVKDDLNVGFDDDNNDDDTVTLGFSEGTEKCIIGLPRNWDTHKFEAFLNQEGILYKTAKKKKAMTVGFLTFTNLQQLQTAVEGLKEKRIGGKLIKLADAVHRSTTKRHTKDVSANDNVSDGNSMNGEELILESKNARDVVTPLAHMLYSEQLEFKKKSLLQCLKRLTRNTRKACPDSAPLPDWIHKSREIGGLPCELEGILPSPLTTGYRNKCEFSVGYSLHGKRTVGFMLGNFREGITAVEEPINCPNISQISCQYARVFQDFLQSSPLPIWNRTENTGFWRQLTVREGRGPSKADEVGHSQIAEVMLIIQVCSLGIEDELIKVEFQRLTTTIAEAASTSYPALPLNALVIQDHKGISNAAPADCPLFPLPFKKNLRNSESPNEVVTEERIHDYICNLRFCISPTAFFQVNTLAAEKLYSFAGDWAGLSPDTLLFDICCGTGTIGLTLAHRVGAVVGIEMNKSAVSDAIRNADINGIRNCRFICAKKGYLCPNQIQVILDSFVALLVKEMSCEYLQHNVAVFRCLKLFVVFPHPNVDDDQAEDVIGSLLSEYLNPTDCHRAKHDAVDDIVKNTYNTEKNDSRSDDNSLRKEKSCKAGQIDSLEDENNQTCTINQHFKDVVVIVDPPRVGLHPTVIKALRTNARLRQLVYISCNPESLVANAIELCTPAADQQQKPKNNGWWTKGSAGLARHRAKSMPKSDPFRPVRAMAVDLFPHTPHCEMVMLFER